MIWGLLLIALIDLASVMTSTYTVFLGLRALGGVGWAMFATVATTVMVNVPTVQRRGRAASLLLMSDSGQILGPLVMGALADAVDLSTPFLFGAALLAAMAWRCRRQADAMKVAVTAERSDS